MSTAASTEPIRLLKLLPTFFCGGTENQFMTLSRSLDRHRFDVELACLRRVGPFLAEAEGRSRPLREYPIDTFRSVRAVAQQARLARHIVQRRIEIVHAYSFYGNVFAIPPSRLAGVPVVIASIRDRGPYLTPMQMRVQQYVCRLATRVLVNADAVKDWLLDQGYDPARIVVIRNGVDLCRFNAPGDPDAIRRELGLAPGVPLVTVVSRLNHLKGVEDFLRAAAMLADRYPTVHFLVVGEAGEPDVHYLTVLTRLADSLGIGGRVRFTGLRSDVPAVLASSTVSVMPSLDEALSNVVLESMAAGVPTVATRVGGTPEAIADGVTGLLVPPGDATAMAEAIARVLKDPGLAAALGCAGRRRIEERFSVDRMVEATEQLYVNLLAEKRPGRVVAWST
ncbi:MAG TPA: glycosyltransferase [Vicinamibacterales bacterium]|nr:glycosyltransferase [Vicinamibacterales bacterium]